MLSHPSRSENICIQTKHACEGTCKQQQPQLEVQQKWAVQLCQIDEYTNSNSMPL